MTSIEKKFKALERVDFTEGEYDFDFGNSWRVQVKVFHVELEISPTGWALILSQTDKQTDDHDLHMRRSFLRCKERLKSHTLVNFEQVSIMRGTQFVFVVKWDMLALKFILIFKEEENRLA
jgi:hypothetical protein